MAFTVATAGTVVLAVRRLPPGDHGRLAGGGLDCRGRGAPHDRSANLAAHPPALLPGQSGMPLASSAGAVINILMLLSGVYWCETLLARFLRLRRAFADEGGAPGVPLPSARLFRANADGCLYYWGFVAGAAVFFWLLYYVI